MISLQQNDGNNTNFSDNAWGAYNLSEASVAQSMQFAKSTNCTNNGYYNNAQTLQNFNNQNNISRDATTPLVSNNLASGMPQRIKQTQTCRGCNNNATENMQYNNSWVGGMGNAGNINILRSDPSKDDEIFNNAFPNQSQQDVTIQIPGPLQQENNAVSDCQGSLVPETVTNAEFFPAYLRKFIGYWIRAEFFMGDQAEHYSGQLLDVGASYIVIRISEPSSLIVCDLFSLKFVTIALWDNDFPIS